MKKIQTKILIVFYNLQIILIKIKIFIFSTIKLKLRITRNSINLFRKDLYLSEYFNWYRTGVLIISIVVAVLPILFLINNLSSGLNDVIKDMIINVSAGAVWATFLVIIVDFGYFLRQMRINKKNRIFARQSLVSTLFGLKKEMATILGFSVDTKLLTRLSDEHDVSQRIGEYNLSLEKQLDTFLQEWSLKHKELINYRINGRNIEGYRKQIETVYDRLERVIMLYSNSLPTTVNNTLLSLEFELKKQIDGLKVLDEKKLYKGEDKKLVDGHDIEDSSGFISAIMLVRMKERYAEIIKLEKVLQLNRYYK